MTKIEWATKVWNPTVGCTKVSQGCQHCYAEWIAALRQNNPATPQYQGTVDKNGCWTGVVRPVPTALNKPLKWRKPQRVFVNSMSDLFHESVEESWILRVFEIMLAQDQHTYIVLTKRPERMREILSYSPIWRRMVAQGLAGHIWLGISAEDQAAYDARWPYLQDTPAAVRIISAEPLLGPIQFRCVACRGSGFDQLNHSKCLACSGDTPSQPNWVIAGGESGPLARPCHPDWFRNLRDQCVLAGIPFFFKQWGEWRGFSWRADGNQPKIPGARAYVHWPVDGGYRISSARLGKTKAGRHLDGRTHDEYPQPQRLGTRGGVNVG
jgi:protein gp37